MDYKPKDLGIPIVHMIPANGESLEEIKRKHRLREAAPELLKACKAAHVSLIGDEHYQEFQNVIKTLEAAILKAEGRESDVDL